MRSSIKDDYEKINDDGEDDMLAVHSAKNAEGVDVEDSESTSLSKQSEKRPSFRELVENSASAEIQQVSGELKKLASCSQPQIGTDSDRANSAVINALAGLKFICTNPWDCEAADKMFHELTRNTSGLLPRALFGRCIGMGKEQDDFAGELFDALSRLLNYKGYLINYNPQMKEFWDQIVDEEFDSRLQIFFALVDKDDNGQISEGEVKELISLSASAYNLSNLRTRADEYGKMIIEELGRDGHSYILIEDLKKFLLEDSSQRLSKELKKPNIIQRTWMYLAVLVLFYACGRLTRAIRSRVKPVEIKWVVSRGAGSAYRLMLRMSKPPGFKFRSGQYIFVNCKAVAPFEWHPFSITSAPGDEDLCVHIRMTGDWTKRLKQVTEGSRRQANGKIGYPKIRIDRPYGTQTQDYEQYDTVLLVGSGMGATPMVSIVKDIVNNVKSKHQKKVETRASNFKTTRAYFYWATKDPDSLAWLKDILADFHEDGYGDVIDMHIHCTSVYEKDDDRVALKTMLESLNQDKYGIEVYAGARAKTTFGRPDWNNVYKHLADSHEGERIGVFCCGVPRLANDLEKLASEFSQKTTTKFEFHNEVF